MRAIFIFLCAVPFFTSCTTTPKHEGFTIKGVAKNYPDSTEIKFSFDNKLADSTHIIKGKFELKGQVSKPTNGIIFVMGTRDFSNIWLENTTMTFEAEKGNFIAANITGSETQKEADILNKMTLPMYRDLDSLMKLRNNKSISEEVHKANRKLINELRQKKLDTSKYYIKTYPNSLVSAHILNIFKTTFPKDSTQKLYSSLSEKIKKTSYGKEIAKYLKTNKNLKVGDSYVDFEQPDPDGKMIKVSDIKKKITLIEFWASWCEPCRKSNPALVKAYQKYHSQGFEIIGVSSDKDRKSWIQAIEKDSLQWPNVSELKGWNGTPNFIYGIKSIPDSFLIDTDGIIIARGLRGENLVKKLAELFNQQKDIEQTQR